MKSAKTSIISYMYLMSDKKLLDPRNFSEHHYEKSCTCWKNNITLMSLTIRVHFSCNLESFWSGQVNISRRHSKNNRIRITDVLKNKVTNLILDVQWLITNRYLITETKEQGHPKIPQCNHSLVFWQHWVSSVFSIHSTFTNLTLNMAKCNLSQVTWL